jgi:hypothetical protein
MHAVHHRVFRHHFNNTNMYQHYITYTMNLVWSPLVQMQMALGC